MVRAWQPFRCGCAGNFRDWRSSRYDLLHCLQLKRSRARLLREGVHREWGARWNQRSSWKIGRVIEQKWDRLIASSTLATWLSDNKGDNRSESVNQKYPTAAPQSRLPSRGWRRWKASLWAVDATNPLVIASNTRSQRE